MADVGPARWATFDCYGTLVDWDGGIRRELGRLFGDDEAGRLLRRYHAIEPRVQAEQPTASYRDVMSAVLAELAVEESVELADEERDALTRSLPGWPVFDDVRGGLAEAYDRDWRLAILSNTDRDLIEESMAAIGAPFELAVVASEIGSYKPDPGHWDAFFERSGADRSRHVHVAASPFHDIRPARKLGLRSIWINRLAERTDVRADVELPDLSQLPDALEWLVPSHL